MDKSKVVKLIGVLYEIRTRRDGGSRIVIDVGMDSLPGIMELQKASAKGDLNLAIAMAPYEEEDSGDDINFDPWP